MWLRKEGTEVEGGRGVRSESYTVSITTPFFLSQRNELPQMNSSSFQKQRLQREERREPFWKLNGLEKCCCVSYVRNKGTVGWNSGCWVMLTARLILCSAGCIITWALNNCVWVESLNASVVLNKAGKGDKPSYFGPAPPPLQAQTNRITLDCLIKTDKLRCQSQSLRGTVCLRCVSAH